MVNWATVYYIFNGNTYSSMFINNKKGGGRGEERVEQIFFTSFPLRRNNKYGQTRLVNRD